MHETFFLVLGLVRLLTVASLLLPLANRINFPYTVLLALAGGVLGAITMGGKANIPTCRVIETVLTFLHCFSPNGSCWHKAT